jgi:hypothetical protein
MTTVEVSNLGRYGFMGGRGGQSLRDQSGAMKQAAAIGAGMGPSGASEEGVMPGDSNGDCQHGGKKHNHGVGACCSKLCAPVMQVLGLDRFTKGKAVSGMARAGRGQNPFDLGVRQVSGCKFTPDVRIALSSGRQTLITHGCTSYLQKVSVMQMALIPGWAAYRNSSGGYQPVSQV